MKFLKKLFSPRYRIFTILSFILLFAYLILHFIFFESDPIVQFLSFLGDSYLLLVEKFSNRILYWIGSGIRIESQVVTDNGIVRVGFDPKFYFKIWMFLFISIIWITKTSYYRRILFTLILILLHFLVLSGYVITGVYLTCMNDPDYDLLTIPLTSGILILFTFVFFWYRKFKSSIGSSLSRLKLNVNRFKNDFQVMAFAFVFILTYYFLYSFFDYSSWINFLFISAQKILGLFGYAATVEPFYLVGEKGSIFMLKSCLGFQTMLLFASIVFLTGNTNNKIRWIFIVAGLLILNFANIMRFVFLFIHLEKHGDYTLSMDVHDMYNYLIYTIVLILWIIWFEVLSDYSRKV